MASAAKGSTKRSRPPPVNEVQTRPQSLASKQGTTGSKVRLQANYFKLNNKPDWCLYQYRVDIAPDEERTIVRKALLRTHKSTIGGYMFDGTVLYTSNPLPQPLELNSIRQEDKQPMKITVRLVGDLVQGDYHYFQIYNMIIRKSLEHLDLQLVGRNYFDAARRVEIREFKLELWPGYVTSIRQHEQSILMCAEISHKVMRDETLYHVMQDAYQKSPRNWQKIFQSEVIGCVVLTGYNNRTYRVDDVDFNVNPGKTFKLRDGTEISYATYYNQKYQIKIKNMTQPLLVSRSKMRDRRAGQDEIVYLIPELCRSTGLTDAMRNDFRLMRALADHTRVAPGARITKLLDFNRRLQTKPEVVADLREWNFQLDTNLVELDGRVLPAEKIYFGQNKVVQLKDDADWNFKLQDHPQLRVGQLKDWVCICPKRCAAEAKTFIDNMIRAAAKIGIVMARPRFFEIADDRTDTYADILSKVTDQSKPQLMLCIVTNNQAMRYAVIKKKLCIDRPIASQVLLARTLTQKSASMMNAIGCKVATQLNCKIGGIPWTVQLGSLLPGLMIVGFDVCHDKKSGGSYGAMVASLDQNFGRYFSSVSQHKSGEELSNDLSMQLVRALQEFAKENQNKLPTRILIYRDGVGEGQIPFVHDFEVGQIKEKLATIYGGKDKFRLGVIIVTKRINTRFFMNKENPKPGTVVDSVITDPLKYDFFIVSQSVRQGTVAPTAYNVIEDNTGINPDKMQMITFKLCHMYFNFSGTVRVPAPCQYAHKLAFFASQTLQQSPHQSLEKTLYFL